MPKRVPEEAKRVPLNCLVLPETKRFLGQQECSQGEAVDRAVSALRSLPPPVVDGMMNQGQGNQDPEVPLSRVVAKELKRQNQNWKRGPRQKGDKSR